MDLNDLQPKPLLNRRVESVEGLIAMKAFLLALIIPAALLVSFRESNSRFELSDLEEFAHLCTDACSHIILRK
jgi:hypothetical protein